MEIRLHIDWNFKSYINLSVISDITVVGFVRQFDWSCPSWNKQCARMWTPSTLNWEEYGNCTLMNEVHEIIF